jgi:hypothetical protein
MLKASTLKIKANKSLPKSFKIDGMRSENCIPKTQRQRDLEENSILNAKHLKQIPGLHINAL